jgi:hypothetical protein
VANVEQDAFNKLESIAGKALDDLQVMTGSQEEDQDLALYNTLTEDDFNDMRRKYGFEKTAEYIKVMEARNMGVKE